MNHNPVQDILKKIEEVHRDYEELIERRVKDLQSLERTMTDQEFLCEEHRLERLSFQLRLALGINNEEAVYCRACKNLFVSRNPKIVCCGYIEECRIHEFMPKYQLPKDELPPLSLLEEKSDRVE